MGFFDDLGNKLNDVAGKATDKVSEITENNRLRSELNSEEQKLRDIYTDLGRRVYELAKDDPTSAFAQQCKEVAEGEKKVAELKAQLEPKPAAPQDAEQAQSPAQSPAQDVKLTHDPYAGAQPDFPPAYPPAAAPAEPVKTAAPAGVEAPAAPAVKKFCPNCGAHNVNGAKFCPTCGTPLSM